MSGRRPFSDLTRDFTPKRRRRIDEMKQGLLAEMPLHELRRARALTQRDMAKILEVNQPAVSKLEQRTDVYVSSLRSYIEAVGGKLKIVADSPRSRWQSPTSPKWGKPKNPPEISRRVRAWAQCRWQTKGSFWAYDRPPPRPAPQWVRLSLFQRLVLK